MPSWVAFSVVRLLEEHFGDLVEYDFTAEMEDDLDHIASGEADRVDWLNEFYFGSDKHKGLRQVVDNLGEIDAREINSVQIAPDVTLRIGSTAPTSRRSSPTPRPTRHRAGSTRPRPRARRAHRGEGARAHRGARAGRPRARREPRQRQAGRREGRPVRPVRHGGRARARSRRMDGIRRPGDRRGRRSGEARSAVRKAAAAKPRTASLFKSMQIEEIDLDTALKLLDLPRVVGADPESGDEITAQNGRYGPYLKGRGHPHAAERGRDLRDRPRGALELFAHPKYGARRASSALKEFDNDPVSGKPIKVKDGRFGPYVTDGTTNATIPRGESVEDITFERAVELLQIKRDKGPAAPRAKRTTATKAPAKREVRRQEEQRRDRGPLHHPRGR